MIRSLRKRHVQTWAALCLLIPAGIVTAFLSIKHPGHSHLWQPASADSLPRIISSFETADYLARLRSKDSIAEQLEWINKQPLTVPSAVIYRTTPEASGFQTKELIGRIETKGIYLFPIRRDSIRRMQTFVLYDLINEKIVDSINLQP